jgi:outer membrane receptor for ferrienterochelin and colicins
LPERADEYVVSKQKLACTYLCLAALVPNMAGQAAKTDLGSMSLEQLMTLEVVGASLHPQSLEDAPASVTIISAEDIRKYGYRTLGEALASVRGFYLNNNRTYHSVGVRGFNLPSDYGSRILVLVNGHNMADNIFDSMLWFGVDFPVDIKLMQRIEVIRGPSSALYGTSGVFATINIITKSSEEAGPVSLTTGVGSFGDRKIQAMGTVPIGRTATLLLSGSVFNNGGENSLYFPALDTPETNYGNAVRMDGERGYHFFGNLVWRDWSVTAVISDRNKIQPVSWGPTVFNDRGTHVLEDSNYVETAYARELRGGTLRWRTWFSQTHLGGRFDYPLSSNDASGIAVEDNRTFSWGDWVGTSLTYRFDVAHIGTLTAGLEGKIDLRAFQGSRDVAPVAIEFVNLDRGDKTAALFLQDERQLSEHWKMDLGVRLDVSQNRRSFVSPRAAFISQPSAIWTYKFLYGRAFRNPSVFDLFYDDGLAAAANPAARPEKADTVEIDVERRVGKRMNLIASAYAYRIHDFLQGVYNNNGLIQTQNVGRIHATGFEIEMNGRPARWLEATASYAIQRSTDDIDKNVLENSPDHLAKLRFAIPLGRKFDVSSGMQYYSSRHTLAGAEVSPVYLADFTVTSKRLLPNFDLQFGLRNSFNQNYSDPIALDARVDSMRQPGRSFFVELTTHGAQ